MTRLLASIDGANEAQLYDRLMPIIYGELRRLAASMMERERANHTLQPTALVNEAFMKLVRQTETTWESKGHFFAMAATAMRRILVDHARGRNCLRRGGDRKRELLESDVTAAQADDVDLLELDDAMTKLARLDERKVRIVELRYFIGLDVEQTAAATGLSSATVKREWRVARIWLKKELGANG